MKGKVAIVSGASRGIGHAIALHLAQQGANLVLCGRDEKLLAETSTKTNGGHVVALDQRAPDAGQHIVDEAIKIFGAIDIVVNNAGATKRGDFLSLTEEDWMDGFALKMFGAVRLSRAAWPHLKARNGAVVFISGSGGRTPGPQFTIGGSVNAALLSLTKALAELGIEDGVQVNCINPGPVRTGRLDKRLAQIDPDPARALEQFIRQERIAQIGEPEDIAALVAFILSPHGRYLHGSLIDADGGSTKTI